MATNQLYTGYFLWGLSHLEKKEQILKTKV